MSSSLAAVLQVNHAKISDRNATYLLAAVIDDFELDPNNYNISRSAIHRGRISVRSNISGKIWEDLQAASQVALSLVVHGDGKSLSDPTGQATDDRFPVFIVGVGTQQVLSVPKLNGSTGMEQDKI